MDLITQYYDEDIVLKRAIDIAKPENITKKTALFYVHGGGWSGGSRDQYHYHLAYFSRHGYFCASTGYRLAPTVHMMDQIGDVATGYDRFLQYIDDNRLGIEQIVVIGSSAGAHLASLLSLTEPSYFNPDMQLTSEWRRPTACVSVNGPGTLEKWPNMHEGIKDNIEQALSTTYGESSDVFRRVSPINHVNGASPDFLFMIVGKEKFFPHQYIHKMNDKLEQYGKKGEVILFPQAEHGFFYGLKNQQQQEALRVLEEFLERYEAL